MAPRPKGTDTAAGKGFDTKAPANAADVAYEGGAPVEQETPVFGPQPTQTGRRLPSRCRWSRALASRMRRRARGCCLGRTGWA